MLGSKFERLVQSLQVLPGVGQKSAQRMALYLLTHKRLEGQALADSLSEAMRGVLTCQICHSFSDAPICPICQDSMRDAAQLCVVEQASHVLAIEQSGAYRGRYFVLGGALSPIDGITAQDLHLDALAKRLASTQGSNKPIKELILATSSTIEGQATAHFIHEAFADLVPKITRLAQGMPMGGDLGYVDGQTVYQALNFRTHF